MTILEQLADCARERTRQAKKKLSADEIKRQAVALPKGIFAFEQALKKPGISFICECKKASPSKGLIAPDFPYLQIAKEYEAAGADCISVLTEPKWFLGSDEYLKEIAGAVSIPCLRKDFTVDEYMIYEAKLLGASAVLLICSILTEEQMKEYIGICDELGMSALVEAHDEAEVQMALNAGARIIGVNNRNLKDFTVDTENSRRLRRLIPPEVLFVSESGVHSAEDVQRLREIGADAVLIGETLMRAPNKAAMLARLRGGIMTKIKLCGLSRACDIEAVNELLPEYIGFVFAPKSRRFVTPQQATELKRQLHSDITAVGVFVNERPETVAELLNKKIIDIAQLHGNEDETYIKVLRGLTDKPIIQAFRVDGTQDIAAAQNSSADYVLLDSGNGGTGTVFDWQLIRQLNRPYFLAGGLKTDNVKTAIEKLNPYAVDISSGIETDGYKDKNKMKEFVHKVRGVNSRANGRKGR